MVLFENLRVSENKSFLRFYDKVCLFIQMVLVSAKNEFWFLYLVLFERVSYWTVRHNTGRLRHTRTFNVCEVRIENSDTRVTFRHHEACGVMLNSYPKWQNFWFASNNHYIFFFLHTLRSLPLTTAFSIECVLFYQFHARITAFSSKKCSVRLLSKKLMSKCLVPNDIKNDVKIDVLPLRTRSSYTPSVRRKYPERVKIAENLIEYARMSFINWY